MEAYEKLLTNEINRITQEHDTIWRSLLFYKPNKVHQKVNQSELQKQFNLSSNIKKDSGKLRIKEPNLNFNGIAFRNKRSKSSTVEPAAIYMKGDGKVRTCQNMNGVLGSFQNEMIYFV